MAQGRDISTIELLGKNGGNTNTDGGGNQTPQEENYRIIIDSCECIPVPTTELPFAQSTIGEIPIKEICKEFKTIRTYDSNDNLISSKELNLDGTPFIPNPNGTIKYGKACKCCCELVNVAVYDRIYTGTGLDDDCTEEPTPIDCTQISLEVDLENGIATINNIPANSNINFVWSVSSNVTILSGQGTEVISFTHDDNEAATITINTSGDCDFKETFNITKGCEIIVAETPKCVDDGKYQIELNITTTNPLTISENGNTIATGVTSGVFLIPILYDSGDNYNIDLTDGGDCNENVNGSFVCDLCSEIGCNLGLAIDVSKPAELSWGELTNDCGATNYIIEWWANYETAEQELIVTSGAGNLFDSNTMLPHPFAGFPFPAGPVTPLIKEIEIDVDNDGNTETFTDVSTCFDPVIVVPIDCTQPPYNLNYEGIGGVAASNSLTFVKNSDDANYLQFKFRAFDIIDCLQIFNSAGTMIYEVCQGQTGVSPILGAIVRGSTNTLNHLIDISSYPLNEEFDFVITGSNTDNITKWNLELTSCCEVANCLTEADIIAAYTNPNAIEVIKPSDNNENNEWRVFINPIRESIQCSPYLANGSTRQLTIFKTKPGCVVAQANTNVNNCDNNGSTIVSNNNGINDSIVFFSQSEFDTVLSVLQGLTISNNQNSYVTINIYNSLCGDGQTYSSVNFSPFDNFGNSTWTADPSTNTIFINSTNATYLFPPNSPCENIDKPYQVENTIGFTTRAIRVLTRLEGNSSIDLESARNFQFISNDESICSTISVKTRLRVHDNNCPYNSWYLEISFNNGPWQNILEAPEWAANNGVCP